MTRDLRRVLISTACSVLVAGSPARAQEDTGGFVTLRGMVVDSAHRPVPGALVYLASAGIFGVTEDTGWFTLSEIQRRGDTLQVRGLGFAPRSFALRVPASGQDTIDVGLVQLDPGSPPTLALTATLHDTLQDRPVAGAQVLLNDVVVGETDTTGSFSATELPVDWGLNVVLVRRVGYAPLVSSLWVGEGNARYSMTGAMRRQAVALPDIVVEADRIRFSFDRTGARRRSERGWGRFFSREDIERRKPSRITDLIRTIPQLSVSRAGPNTRIEFTLAGQRCAPMVWLDGTQLVGWDLDAAVNPQSVTWIEVYRAFEIPVQFSGGNSCGAIVIWTR